MISPLDITLLYSTIHLLYFIFALLDMYLLFLVSILYFPLARAEDLEGKQTALLAVIGYHLRINHTRCHGLVLGIPMT
jgi:hypothetical protein